MYQRRKVLDIPLEGEPALQHLMNVHFFSPSLGRRLTAEGRGAMLYFVFNREVVAVVVAHDVANGEFVLQVRAFAAIAGACVLSRCKCSGRCKQHFIGTAQCRILRP